MKYLLNCRSFIFLMVLFSFFDNFGMEKYDYKFKVVFIGDAGVGKTQIIIRYVRNIFDEGYPSSTGVVFTSKIIEFESKKIMLQLWDTAGQEKYRSLIKSYYKDFHLIVFVYAIDDKDSFNSISNYWVKDVTTNTNKKPKFLLVGNKCDLKKDESVSTEEAQEYAKKNEMEFIEVSAKEGTNINDMFKSSIEKLLNDMKKEKNNFFKKTEVGNIELNNPEIKNSQDDNNVQKKNDINNNGLSFCDKYCSCCPCLKKSEKDNEEQEEI